MPLSINLPPGAWVGDLFIANNISADDSPELNDISARVVPEAARLREVCAKAQASFAAVSARGQELSALVTDRERKLNELRYTAYLEAIDNAACDYSAIASQLAQPEAESALLREAVNLVNFVQVPQAQEIALEAAFNSANMDALEASVLCALEQAENLRRTEGAFPGQRVAVISERVMALENEAKEFKRRAAEAQRTLNEWLAARQAQIQVRVASGHLSIAESVHASRELSRSTEPKE